MTAALFLLLLGMFSSSRYQTWQVQRLTEYLEEKAGIPLSVGRVHFIPFRTLFLEDLCVYNQQKDTVLYVPELEARLRFFSWKRNVMAFSKARLTRPDIHFRIDSLGVLDFQFILDRFEKKDTAKSVNPFHLEIQDIQLDSGRFRLSHINPEIREYGINFSDLDMHNICLRAGKFRIPEEGGVAFHIDSLQAIDKSGFEIQQLSAGVLIDTHHLSFENVEIHTPGSRLLAPTCILTYEHSRDMGSGNFESRVDLNVELLPSRLLFSDLSYFVPSFKVLDDTLFLSARVSGRIADLRGQDVDLKIGKRTRFQGDIEMKGLPDLENTYIFCDVNHFETSPADVESLPLGKSGSGKLSLPPVLHRLEFLQFKGNFTGFIQDFVAYGQFRTGLGQFSTDILFTPVRSLAIDDTSSVFSYRGLLQAANFNLGALLDSERIGKISLETSLDGTMSRRAIVSAELEGNISTLEIQHYPYQNIALNGALHGKTYNGEISVDDPHLKGTFSGMADLSGQLPGWKFSADVRQADLFDLHLMPSDSAWFASFGIEADFSGDRIDNLSGEIRLKNALMKKTGNVLQMNDFLLFTKKIAGENRFILRSDVVDAEVWGQYSFATLKTSFLRLLHQSLPSLVYAPVQASTEPDENRFQYEINFKNTSAISDFILPGVYISRSSLFKGNYHAGNGDVSLSVDIPFVEIKGKGLYDIQSVFSMNGRESNLDVRMLNLRLNDKTSMGDLHFRAHGEDDKIQYQMAWGTDTLDFKGELRGKLGLVRQPGRLPKMAFSSEASEMFLNGMSWRLDSAMVLVDSTSVKIDRMLLHNRDQSVELGGTLSSDPEEPLRLAFHKMELSLLNMIVDRNTLQLDGQMSGTVDFMRLYEKPLIGGDLSIDSLAFNGEFFGNAVIRANYDQVRQSVMARFESWDQARRSLFLDGQYTVNSGLLDFDVYLQEVGLGLTQPFLKGVFSDIEGQLTGQVKITGSMKNPVMNGGIALVNVGWMVDFLKTRYRFSTTVQVAENAFLLNRTTLFDRHGQTCVAEGKITHRFFKDFMLDLQLNARNFEALNIAEHEADIFYGTGYASGTVGITGPMANLDFRVRVRTEPNTRIFIPLSDQTSISQVDYISFVEKTPEKSVPQTFFDVLDYDDRPLEEQYVVNKKGISLDIELEVMPSAEVQLIFDPRSGEVIRGSGSGTLRFMLSPNGRFNMYGTYVVDRGDYLFTLQNLFQRKFDVQRGGSIVWNGNPVDAIINMTAVYRTRTSLDGLLNMNNGSSASRRVPVECILQLSDRLMKPELKFDLQMPEVDQDVRELVAGLLYNEEQKARQVISLLILNSFYSDISSTSIDPSSIATDVLSNQLGRILDRFSDKFSIGVGYHRYNQLQAQVIELTASASLFKERLNASLTVANREIINTSNPVTLDGNLEYRLTHSGRYYLKAFNRSNDLSLLEPDTYYTQGLGLVYRTDFDRFSDLFIRKKRIQLPKDGDSLQQISTPVITPGSWLVPMQDSLTFPTDVNVPWFNLL